MKCNQSLLTGILVFYLMMVMEVSGAEVKKNTSAFSSHFTPALCVSPSAVFNDTDTTPKPDASKLGKEIAAKAAIPKIAPPKIEAPKDSKNLFKKIADAFKFRKNAQAKEKERVLDIFKGLGITDSIAATSENIQLLIDELSIRENQHFNALLVILDSIKNAKPPKPVIIVPKDESTAAEPSESKVVTDKDIEDLTNKLLPLIAEKNSDDKNSKEKRSTLAILRKIGNGSPQEVHLIIDSAKGIVRRFKLRIKNSREVYAIHNFVNNSSYDDYKFSFINTLLYNSLFVNGKTGNIKEMNGWDTARLISDAQRSGTSVVFTARIQQATSTEAFLWNVKSQEVFIDNAIYLLKLRNAGGVNIRFDGMAPVDKLVFTQFIKTLSASLKKQNPNYKVLVTVPAFEDMSGYDLKEVSAYADRILLNFSLLDPSKRGPMAPLAGKRSMESVVSLLLNKGVPEEKLVPSVSYIGTKWAGKRFIQRYTYSEIKKRYDWPVYYDDKSASAVMDSLNKKQVAIQTIFFDDAVSLEKKYDFIIQDSLAGVCIDALGYDKGYGELWDALSYKFTTVDTVKLKDSIIVKNAKPGDLNFIQKIGKYFTLFGYILKNPCEICFEKIPDSLYSLQINQDLQELKIDSLIIEKNKKLPVAEKYRSRFQYVNSVLTSFLGWLTLLMLILTLACGAIYLYKIKKESEAWPLKKKAEIILILLCVLLVLCSFTYLFSNDTIPLFGSTPDTASTKLSLSKDLSGQMAANNSTDSTTTLSDDINSSYCNTDPDPSCINMPLTTLMLIIGTGMVIGMLITRYLIMPLLRRDDIP